MLLMSTLLKRRQQRLGNNLFSKKNQAVYLHTMIDYGWLWQPNEQFQFLLILARCSESEDEAAIVVVRKEKTSSEKKPLGKQVSKNISNIL